MRRSSVSVGALSAARPRVARSVRERGPAAPAEVRAAGRLRPAVRTQPRQRLAAGHAERSPLRVRGLAGGAGDLDAHRPAPASARTAASEAARSPSFASIIDRRASSPRTVCGLSMHASIPERRAHRPVAMLVCDAARPAAFPRWRGSGGSSSRPGAVTRSSARSSALLDPAWGSTRLAARRDTGWVMSGELTAAGPLDGTRQLHRLLNSRDLNAVTDLFAPGSIWDASRWGLGSHEAPASLRRFLQDWIGSFDVYELALEEIQDLGNGIVFAVFFHAADLQGGGGSLRVRSWAVLDWRAGHLVGLTSYRDVDEARAAGERLAHERW